MQKQEKTHALCTPPRRSRSQIALLHQEHISGLLNLGLACQELGSTRAMCGILAMIFERELIIDHNPPPGKNTEIAAHRAAVYNLYLPVRGVQRSVARMNRKRRFILRYFMNSDITQALRHHCVQGCCRSAAEITNISIVHVPLLEPNVDICFTPLR